MPQHPSIQLKAREINRVELLVPSRVELPSSPPCLLFVFEAVHGALARNHEKDHGFQAHGVFFVFPMLLCRAEIIGNRVSPPGLPQVDGRISVVISDQGVAGVLTIPKARGARRRIWAVARVRMVALGREQIRLVYVFLL